MDDRRRREWQLVGPDHSQHDPVRVEREPARGQETAEEEDRREPVVAERPAERCESDAEADEQQPRLGEVPRDGHS